MEETSINKLFPTPDIIGHVYVGDQLVQQLGHHKAHPVAQRQAWTPQHQEAQDPGGLP